MTHLDFDTRLPGHDGTPQDFCANHGDIPETAIRKRADETAAGRSGIGLA